jgi:hypothetical protein
VSYFTFRWFVQKMHALMANGRHRGASLGPNTVCPIWHDGNCANRSAVVLVVGDSRMPQLKQFIYRRSGSLALRSAAR